MSTAQRSAPPPTLHLRVLVGLVVGLAGLRFVPPITMAVLVPALVAGEASPLVALLATLLAVAALRRRPRQPGLAALALVAGIVASVPTIEGWSAGRAGAAAIAALPVTPAAPHTAASPAPALLAPSRDVPAADGRTVRYTAADGTPLTARLYRSAGAGARPTLVVLYGGAWRGGDAGQFAALHRRLARAGYVVVALDYRHAPAHSYPAQRDDAQRGLALVRDSARVWGVDPARLVLWGRSSGAQLAMLTGWTDQVPGARPLRGVISYYGPVDLPAGYAHPPRPDPIDARHVLRDFLGGTPGERAARYADASPITHVRSGLPPTLLVYGGHDHLVEARYGREVATALRAAGDPVAAVTLPWAEHGFDAIPGGVGDVVATSLTRRFLARVAAP